MITIIVTVFILGYLAIATEHSIKINKAATSLLTGVLCWTVLTLFTSEKDHAFDQLMHHMGDISGILFFLLGAMTIVELVDSHEGFDIITSRITQTNKRKLLWLIVFITFFLSAIIDNLTTAIVVVSLLKKLVNDEKVRLLFAGIVIIAANAGGAWSPIGDVTTTMLWIGGQITAFNIIMKLILPSLICIIIPLLIVSYKLKGQITRTIYDKKLKSSPLTVRQKSIILFSGITVLISIPLFKAVTGLPPFMGMLLGLGILWIITEIIHVKKQIQDRQQFSVVHALQKIDSPSILFFLGILLAVAALESSGILRESAQWLSTTITNENYLVISLGLLSSVIDNVPLVAAVQGMYSLQQFPTDHYFWEFLAYSTGTGGSTLIIGSAAGVAAMGIEKISFIWYLKNISLLALIGFLAGACFYIIQNTF